MSDDLYDDLYALQSNLHNLSAKLEEMDSRSRIYRDDVVDELKDVSGKIADLLDDHTNYFSKD